MNILNGANLIDRRICNHDRHFPLLRYRVQVIEKVPRSVLLSGVSRFESARVHQVWTIQTASYAQDAVYGIDGTQTCAEFPIDAIFARPQGIFSTISFCQFDVDARIREQVVLNQNLLWCDFHRRIDKDNCRWV